MGNVLKLVIAPDVRLTKVSEPVKEVDDGIRRLMDDMLATMYHEEGAGIAAVQVGVLQRVIIIDVSSDESFDASLFPMYIANPEIISKSEECEVRNEGCLSFPEQRLEIKRPSDITIKFLDYNNNIQQIDANGWLATAIQHEIDHLDGVVITDHASKLKRDMMVRKAQKMKKLING